MSIALVAMIVLILVAALLGAFVLGVGGGVDGGATTTPFEGAVENTATNAASETDSATRTPTSTPTRTAPVAPDVTVRIKYPGEWTGAISVTGDGSSTTESISGQGGTTFDISGDPQIVSANAQKRDGRDITLVIQIRVDGAVVAEAEASSEYGVAQVSHSLI